MNSNLLLIIFTLLIFSCKRHKGVNIKKETVKPVINSEIPEIKEKPKFVLNTTIKQDLLGGIWVSKQYDSLLKATHSLVSAEKKLKTYSDIIYSGDSLLHCNYPYYQEEHQLKVFNNLSVGSNREDINFKITQVDKKEMTIQYKDGSAFKYYKIEKEIERSNIFSEVRDGHIIQEKKWFSGDYILTISDKNYELFINKDGIIKGKSPYINCEMYTWYEDETEKEYDILSLKTDFKEDTFIIELATTEDYHLQKINEFEGVGENIVKQDVKAVLKKDNSRDYYIGNNNETFDAISLDELIDENYNQPSLTLIDSYIKQTLPPNNQGEYNLDSLQKIYQSKFVTSKIIQIDNSLTYTHVDGEDDNINYENSGGIENISENITFMMPENKIYYVFVSKKNKMLTKLVYDNPFYGEVYKPGEQNIYDDDYVKFINGKQMLIDYPYNIRTPFLNSVFHKDMKTGENYLHYVKLKTEQDNIFYSNVTKIKCKKEYDYSELEKFKEDIHQFETKKYKIQEYLFDKNGDKQILQLVFLEEDKFLFNLKANTQTCESTVIGKANDIFRDKKEYFVENKSEIKKLIFNKEKTKVKIVMNDDVAADCCSLIEEVMELVKE